jgi:hypothetical protein
LQSQCARLIKSKIRCRFDVSRSDRNRV